MPTVLRVGPYRFFFYAGDRAEPPHVHVERDDDEAKFWLDPVVYSRSIGFSRRQLNTIQGIIEEHERQLLDAWNEYFNG